MKMHFLANVAPDVIKTLYTVTKDNRDKSNENSNVLNFLNVSIDECTDPIVRDKILSLKNEFEKGKVNSLFVINRVGMLLGIPTATNYSNQTSHNNYQYIINVLQENQANN